MFVLKSFEPLPVNPPILRTSSEDDGTDELAFWALCSDGNWYKISEDLFDFLDVYVREREDKYFDKYPLEDWEI